MPRFPKHPLAVETTFRRCLLVNFALDPAVLRQALPEHIEPDEYRDRAFVSVVIAQMDKLRPLGVPKILGFTYNQIVYRAVVRCHGERGIHFLRSDADSRLMCFIGNLITILKFNHAEIDVSEEQGQVRVDVTTANTDADIHASYDLAHTTKRMPPSSLFPSLPEAQDWLVELFAAFDFDATKNKIEVLRIKRGDWRVSLVEDLGGEYKFMQRGRFGGHAQIDSIFFAEELPYHWFRLERIPV